MSQQRTLERREFLQVVAAGACVGAAQAKAQAGAGKHPNVVYVFGDQWRAQAMGYAGDTTVQPPRLYGLARESVNAVNAVSACPVCSPHRGSLMTGQYPLTHGVFLNDVQLRDGAVSIAEAFNGAGYQTAYIGKWHLDGHGRSNYIPRERRQGFEFWRVLECTHNYNRSAYYGDDPEKRFWAGYDAIAQTREAQRYLREDVGEQPFALFLSWGPPHNPYETAPEAVRQRYRPGDMPLRPNVPQAMAKRARKDLAGYYAHCTALDSCVGDLLDTLEELGLAENTVFVFTSDHGDMLGSQGQIRKQRPWDESIRVPFLLRYPALLGREGRAITHPLNAPDIMPTLLGLCGVPCPEGVEGIDLSGHFQGGPAPADDGALIACYAPFGEWTRQKGGIEYRGLRTPRYTYVRTIKEPWLLYDNEKDPYQRENLCGRSEYAALQAELETRLAKKLAKQKDAFLPGEAYVAQWGYKTDENGTVRYTP